MVHQVDELRSERQARYGRRPVSSAERKRVKMSAPEIHIPRDTWEQRHSARLALTDLVVLALAVLIAAVTKFGTDATTRTQGPVGLTYTQLGAIIVATWWLSLILYSTRDQRVFDDGAEEYRRVIKATIFTFSLLAIASLLLKMDMSRGYLAIAFPGGMIGLVLSRRVWRTWLRNQRYRGRGMARVLMVGGVRSSTNIARTFDTNKTAGFRVNGVWVPDRHHTTNQWLDVSHRFVPVLGTERTLAEALEITNANTVIVTDTEHLGHEGVRELMWQLEGAGVDLMVSPNMIDVAGARLHMRGIAGMSFLHLEEPQYAEAGTWPKTVFDRTLSVLLLLCLAPALVAVALAVRLSSPGPILYRSERVGTAGAPFEMLKFRSMTADADAQITALEGLNQGAGPLFKIRDDPRVTPVGKVLRRYSIDELPQLINVLKGEMSFVGPRPPLPSEVAAYEGNVRRRLLVRQGITGLWQVSGRSDLTWEESVRLDLDYVENWSMVRDLQIIWRTVRAVFRSKGAY